MLNIFLVDDHAVVREGLKAILAETPDMTVVGEAAHASEIFDRIGTRRIDAIILDLSMPGSDGFELMAQIHRRCRHVPVLVLTMHPEQHYGPRLLKAGAAGFLMKDSAPALLVTALRKITSGGRFISPALAEHLAGGLQGSKPPPHERLSDREYTVLRLIATGKSVKEIGDHLSLSVKTVSTYRKRILDKMELKNNAEMTRYMIEHGLTD